MFKISEQYILSRTNCYIFFMYFFGIFFSFAQCPTTTSITQSFCDIQSPTVADLQAIDNGSGIAWFSTASSITPLAPGTGLINGEDYFLDNSAGDCGNRTAVIVSLYTAPIGQNFQGVCVSLQSEATLASLIVAGNNVQWYATSTSVSPLPITTVLTTGTIYYAGQTNPDTGCLTSRLPVFVVVNIVAVPTGDTIQFVCNTLENPPTVDDLIASGTNNWYLTSTSALVLSPETPLIDGQTYYGTTSIPPCESAERIEVLVNFVPENNAGENANLGICEIDLETTADINLFENLTGMPSNLGTWTGPVSLNNGNLGTLDVSALSPLGSPYVFSYTVDNSPVCPPDTATITITVIENVNAGTNGIGVLCKNDVPTDLFTFLGGNPDLGGTWTPALTSGTGIFDPTIDLAAVYTYSLAGLESCPADSATVTISVIDDVDAGISGSATFCESDAPIDLFTFLGGTPDLGGTWSPALNSGTGIFDPSVDLEGIYTYTILGTNPCPTSFATVSVTIIESLNAGINGSATFCENDAPTDLFTFLGGTPDLGGTWTPALISGTGIFDPFVDVAGIYTYTLAGTETCPSDSATVTVSIIQNLNAGIDGESTFCENDSPVNLFNFLGGTPDVGGTWTPSMASGNGVFNPSVDAAGIYTYTLIGSPTCPTVSATVTVAIIENLNAGINGSIIFCESENATDLFDVLGGNPDLGGTWTPILASGTGIFNPSIDLAGVYTYTHTGTGSCPPDSATVTVVVDQKVDAGQNGIYSICESDLPTAIDVNLYEKLLGTPSSMGIWTGPVATTNGNLGTLNVSSLAASGSPYVFTYTVTSLNSCPSVSATVTVIINPILEAGNNGIVTFCKSDSPSNLFTYLGGTPDSGGTWSPSLASGSGIFNPLLDSAGIYTYTLPGTACPSDAATVTVTLVESANSGISGNVNFCENDSPVNLLAFLGGTPDLGGTWTPSLASGSGVFNPSVDAAGIYTYTIQGTSPCPTTSSTITVAVDKLPTNTFADINLGTICLNTETNVTITNATNLVNGNYQLTYQIFGTITFNTTITVFFENGNASFTIPASVLNMVGNSILTINPIQSNVANACGISGNFFNPVSFTIEDIETPVLTGTPIFCETDNATIADLSSQIIEPQNIQWYDAPTDGNLYANTDALIDGTTYYASIVSSSGCESSTRLEITVTVKDCKEDELIIPDGFSPNGDGINDTFEIKNIRTLYPNFSIEIFNRWGNKIFDVNAAKPDWDGHNQKGMKLGGEKAPVGVYFFIINFNDGVKKDIQGRVYLSR